MRYIYVDINEPVDPPSRGEGKSLFQVISELTSSGRYEILFNRKFTTDSEPGIGVCVTLTVRLYEPIYTEFYTNRPDSITADLEEQIKNNILISVEALEREFDRACLEIREKKEVSNNGRQMRMLRRDHSGR